MERKIYTFKGNPEVDAAIAKERKRLDKKVPGSRVTRSVAVRSLIVKASATVDKTDG